jgi:hypothetical protein
MKDDTDGPTARNSSKIGALVSMLDYAMLEGAEMRLPLFVTLLRLARLDLMDSLGSGRCPKMQQENPAGSPRATRGAPPAPPKGPQ